MQYNIRMNEEETNLLIGILEVNIHTREMMIKENPSKKRYDQLCYDIDLLHNILKEVKNENKRISASVYSIA